MNYTLAEQIADKLIEQFDYEKVYCHMEYDKWVWITPKRIGVPSIQEMKETNRKYILETYNTALDKLNKKLNKKKTTARMTTGGYVYETTVYRSEERPYMRLSFVLTDCDNYN